MGVLTTRCVRQSARNGARLSKDSAPDSFKVAHWPRLNAGFSTIPTRKVTRSYVTYSHPTAIPLNSASSLYTIPARLIAISQVEVTSLNVTV